MGRMSYSDDERADQDRAALYARIQDLERDELIQAAKWYRERSSVALHEAALAEKDARIKELEESLASLRRDALRYRCMRACDPDQWDYYMGSRDAADMESRIDAAMRIKDEDL